MRGQFITLEGIEGVGKSTNLEFVADRLRSAGMSVRVTREPGGTPLAEAIRTLLLHGAHAVAPLAELLMVFAARASHLDEVIRPALAEGHWVVCDRFTDATYAYQGGGRGIATAAIATLQQLVQGDLAPDLTLLLDAAPATTQARQANRAAADRFEREDPGFFARVRAAYQALAVADPERIRVIDAGRPLADVQASLAGELERFLGRWRGRQACR